jgi:SAM-dependent methyltransferase
MIYQPQVQKTHYFSDYDNKPTWMRYWHIIQQVTKTKPNNILEIGKGNGTVSSYLLKSGFNVVTVDFDAALEPDFVCSVIELTKYLSPKSFDTVICSEVLEHLKYEDFPVALNQIHQICKNYLLLTLPQSVMIFSSELKFPFFSKRTFLKTVALRRDKPLISKDHYWEIEMRDYPAKKIKSEISKLYSIVDSYTIPENPISKLYLLKPTA